MELYDLIVIGSGAGGLAAALQVAGAGWRVAVLEAAPVPGGYLNTYDIRGWRFDTGLHYLGELGPGGSFRKLLERLGLWDRLVILDLPRDGFGEYHFGSVQFLLPPSKDGFRQVLMDLAPGRRMDVARFFRVLALAEQASSALGRPKRRLGDKVRAAAALPVLAALSSATYAQVLDWVTDHPALRAALSAFSGEVGLPPSRCSALVALLVFSHYLRGAYYPRGGGAGIRDAAVELLQERGAIVRTRFRVTSIRGEPGDFLVEGRPTVPGSEPETYRARAVVAATDPKVWTEFFQPELGLGRLQERARTMEPSVGAFYAFVGLDQDLRNRGWTGRHLAHADSLDPEAAWAIMLAPTLPDEPSMFLITSPTLKDPGGCYAPEGHTALEILTMMSYEPWKSWAGTPSRRRGSSYRETKERFGRALLRKAARYLPDLEDHLAFCDFATPLTNEYWVAAPAGGCYGPAQVPGQVGLGRFQPVTPNPGIFLAGAGVFGGGVFPAMRAGELAGRAACRFLARAPSSRTGRR